MIGDLADDGFSWPVDLAIAAATSLVMGLGVLAFLGRDGRALLRLDGIH